MKCKSEELKAQFNALVSKLEEKGAKIVECGNAKRIYGIDCTCL